MQGEGLIITFDTASDATRLGSAHKAGGEKIFSWRGMDP